MFNTIERAINFYAYDKKTPKQELGTFIISPTRINTFKAVRVDLFYRYKGKNIICVKTVRTVNSHLVNDEDLYNLVEVEFLKECFNFINSEYFEKVLNGENI